MLTVSTTELKQNLGKYLTLVDKENIIITLDGIPVAKLSPAKEKEVNLVSQLVGIIPNDGTTMDDVRRERLREDKDPHR